MAGGMNRSRRRKNKPNATGRDSTSGRFARLGFPLLTSNAYRALSPNARALLVELIMLENGENNGSLFLSERDAAARMGVADHHIAGRAFCELEDMGFIAMTRDAHFHIKTSSKSRARCWRLSWLAFNRKPPTNEWQTREPEPKSRERRRMERGLKALKAYRKARDQNKMPGVDSNSLDPIIVSSKVTWGVHSTPATTENSRFESNINGVDSTPHSAVTMGYGGTEIKSAWWANAHITRAVVTAALFRHAVSAIPSRLAA